MNDRCRHRGRMRSSNMRLPALGAAGRRSCAGARLNSRRTENHVAPTEQSSAAPSASAPMPQSNTSSISAKPYMRLYAIQMTLGKTVEPKKKPMTLPMVAALPE